MQRGAALGWQRSSNGEAAGSPTADQIWNVVSMTTWVPSASEGDGAWALVPLGNGATVESPVADPIAQVIANFKRVTSALDHRRPKTDIDHGKLHGTSVCTSAASAPTLLILGVDGRLRRAGSVPHNLGEREGVRISKSATTPTLAQAGITAESTRNNANALRKITSST
jgi:hypothetical protein